MVQRLRAIELLLRTQNALLAGGQPTSHGPELFLGERHPDAAALSRYLDEAGLCPRSDLSRKPNSVTHLLFLITRAF